MCNVVHRLSFPIAVLSLAWTMGFTAPAFAAPIELENDANVAWSAAPNCIGCYAVIMARHGSCPTCATAVILCCSFCDHSSARVNGPALSRRPREAYQDSDADCFRARHSRAGAEHTLSCADGPEPAWPARRASSVDFSRPRIPRLQRG